MFTPGEMRCEQHDFMPLLRSLDSRAVRTRRVKTHLYRDCDPNGSVYLRLLNLKWGDRSWFMGPMGHMGHLLFEQA